MTTKQKQTLEEWAADAPYPTWIHLTGEDAEADWLRPDLAWLRGAHAWITEEQWDGRPDAYVYKTADGDWAFKHRSTRGYSFHRTVHEAKAQIDVWGPALV